MKSRLAQVALFLILVVLCALPASADSTGFKLTFANSQLTGYPEPYIDVTVTLIAGGATIRFDSLTTNGNTYWMIDGGSMALNINGNFTVTATGGFAPASGYPIIGSGNISGFGDFNLTLKNKGGFGDKESWLSVTLSGNWAHATDVLKANSNGSRAASHVAPTDGCTGYVSDAAAQGVDSTQSCYATPEPNSLLMLGSGLLALLFVFGRSKFSSYFAGSK